MDRVQQTGCIICRERFASSSPAEIHHIRGKTVEFAHFWVLPLCWIHHRAGHKLYGPSVSRHPFKSRFEKEFGTEESLWKKVCDRLGETPCPSP